MLEIETKLAFKHNKKMIFTDKDKIYHDSTYLCHKAALPIKRLEIIVTKHVSREEVHVGYVILDISKKHNNRSVS